jgi:hypothetical protein
METRRLSLKGLQAAPHHIKVRWLIALSCIAFVIIAIIWLMALPSMVALAPPATEANPNPKAAASIFDVFNGK